MSNSDPLINFDNNIETITLAELAYFKLEDLITTLQLKPGAVLSEQKLAKDLNIGRSPIREALQKLAQEGLVIILPRRGILVSDINLDDIRKTLVVRRVLEDLQIRSVCEFATLEERREFLSIAEEFKRLAGKLAKSIQDEDLKTVVLVDSRFDHLLQLAANNEFIAKSTKLMSGITRRFWYKYSGISDHVKCVQLHADIARAVAENKPDTAVEYLNVLLDYLHELTSKVANIR